MQIPAACPLSQRPPPSSSVLTSQLLIIVVADIDKKGHHKKDGKYLHDDKECDGRRKRIELECEIKKRWDRDCDDWKREKKCDKKEHFHLVLECEVEKKGRDGKLIDGRFHDGKECDERRKKIELECEAKRRWDHDCERFKKEGRCDDKNHFHFVLECEVEVDGRHGRDGRIDGKHHDGKDCDDRRKKIEIECEAKRRWDRDCDDWRREKKCDKKEHFHRLELECEVEIKGGKDGKDGKYWKQ